MNKEQRNWMLDLIIRSMEYATFQWEVERLEKMMPKYVDPKYQPSPEEVKEDINFIDKMMG